MYYSYVEIEYIATSFSPARTDLSLKLLMDGINGQLISTDVINVNINDDITLMTTLMTA